MKTVDYFWENPALKPFCKVVPEGALLFKQNELGDTMFIIRRGLVELHGERDGKSHLVALLSAGHILGEKAILAKEPHRRYFTARTKTETVLLELGLADIERTEAASPGILVDLFKHMFQSAAQRLDNSNRLVSVLRSSDNVERLLHLIVYFAETSGRPTSEGMGLLLTVESLRYYIDMSEFEVEECLKELVRLGLLKADGKNYYVLRSEKKLLRSGPQLKQQLPAITPI